MLSQARKSWLWAEVMTKRRRPKSNRVFMILESTRNHQVTVFGLDSYLTFSFLGCQAVGCTYQGNIIPDFKKEGIEKNISVSFIKIIFLSDFVFCHHSATSLYLSIWSENCPIDCLLSLVVEKCMKGATLPRKIPSSE